MSALLARAPRLKVVAALAVFLALAAGAAAQTETGRITGVITDATGGILPGVTVTAKSVGTGATRELVTDSAGQYVFANLPPGSYEITANLASFRPETAKVTVTVGGAINVDLKLQIAGTTETLNVVAEVPVINVVNAEVATTVNQTQIRELPTLTRDVYDLVSVAGNVAYDESTAITSGAAPRGAGYSINGMRASSTNVLLDGSANNDEFTGSKGQDVPLDSVQEFSVVTSNFSAQYGRASGGVVNVATMSGTNSFRGTAYEFYRSDKLSANTYENNANEIEKGEFTRHQLGFSVGGPIRRDKMHFFTNLEKIRVRSADTLITWVPTPEFIAASAGATRNFFSSYGSGATINGPILSRGDVSAIVGSGSGAFSALPANLPVFGRVEKSLPIDAGGGDPQDQYQWVSRLDYSLSNNTQMYFRYAWQDIERQAGTISASPYGGYDTGEVVGNHNVLGSLTHVFSPTFTAQSKVVWNRLEREQPLNGDPQPTLYMNPTGVVRLQGTRIGFPGYLPFNPGTAIPFGGPQSLLQLYQDQTWIKGKHDFRFGGSFVHMSDDRVFGAYANAVESLNITNAVLPSLDNFVLGQIARFNTAINPKGYPGGGTYVTPVELPSFLSHNRYKEYALYVNDNWSVRNRLTLNLGLRYEYFGPQEKSDPKYDSNFYYADAGTSVNTSSAAEIVRALQTGQAFPSNESPIGQLWKSDRNDFAPRIGFAWDVTGDGRTSVRGGYGMAYERNFGNVTFNVLFNPPLYAVASIDAGVDVPSMPIFSDPLGPFGGVAGVTKPIPVSSFRHIDQNIETAYAHFYSGSFQRELRPGLSGSVEYTGSSGRKLYDLADPNKIGAAFVYLGTGGPLVRPNTAYSVFNTRGNRGQSQYHGVTFGLDARQVGSTGLQLTARYTVGNAKDNLSNTFSEGYNGNFVTGYLDPFDAMLDYGAAEFDIRHRLNLSGVWALPFAREASGLKKALAGDWQLAWIFTARTGYPFTLWDCTNGFAICMRAEDPVGLNRSATGGAATGNPNEFNLLDLTPLLPSAGGYVHPTQGTSDFGPYPDDMMARNAIRGPGFWNVDFILSKRVRFGSRALQLRAEAYNLFNHANMYPHADTADLASTDFIGGYKDGNRRMQFGVKFEF